MSLTSVSPGATVTIETYFMEKNQPFVADEPALFEIRDPNGLIVIQSHGAQDAENPARWFALVTFPENLPEFPSDRKYTLGWFIKNKTHKRTNFEHFIVIPKMDNVFLQSDRLLTMGNNLTDYLLIPKHFNLSAPPTANLRDATDWISPIPADAIRLTGQTFDCNIWSFTSDALQKATPDDNNHSPYIVEWSYVPLSAPPQSEYHFIYIINTKVIIFVNDIRRLVDKAQNQDINPNLQYTELDLVHYLNQGLQKINSWPGRLTSYSLANVPQVLWTAVTYAGAYEALQANYLAEGISTFNFGGQSVTLDVDRTPYIDATLNRLTSYLEQTVPLIKRNLVLGSSGGVLGISVGASTNRMGNAANVLNQIRLPGSISGAGPVFRY